MSHGEVPTRFMAKTWIYQAKAIIFGFLGSISLMLGPPFLLGMKKKVNGESATEAGIALTVLSVPMLLIFAQAVCQVRARRLPMLRLHREGIEVMQIGATSLDGIPMIPGVIRVAWAILSTQGFRTRVIRIPWGRFRAARVSGMPMARCLTIVAVPEDAGLHRSSGTEQVMLTEDQFSTPLDEISSAIERVARSPRDCEPLTSWVDVKPGPA